MKGSEFKRIRNNLNLTQDELADVLGFSGKVAISNIETDFRQPSLLVVMIMLLLDEAGDVETKSMVKRLKEFNVVARRKKQGHK